MRYKWEDSASCPQYSELHTDRRLPKFSAEHEGGIFGRDVPPEFQGLADALLAIPGVEYVSTGFHSIKVKKGVMFGWDEIKPKVVELIEARFDPPAIAPRPYIWPNIESVRVGPVATDKEYIQRI